MTIADPAEFAAATIQAADDDPSGLRALMSRDSHSWPEPLGPAAYHGITGEFARLVEPHTEADQAAIIVQFLIAAGSMIGRGLHFTAGGRDHYGNLNTVVVGRTARGRKGTSLRPAITVLGAVDEGWEAERLQAGLSSGEGLIYAVRDSILKGEEVLDEGVSDKRLLVVEEEFGSVLKVLQREGNTLSTTLRQAFDADRLRTLTRNTPLKATRPYISVIGHITLEELQRELTATDAASGLANRFLWTLARRSQLLPDGGAFHKVDVAPLVRHLRQVTDAARKRGGAELMRDEDANELWHRVYPDISDELTPGLLGAVTARAEPITMRVALIYAILDDAREITREHLKAALEVWRYSFASAAFIFGGRTGDDYADRIEDDLTTRPDGEMTRTEIRDLFGKHAKQGRIDAALVLLVDMGRVEIVRKTTGGRPAEVVRQKRHMRPKGV